MSRSLTLRQRRSLRRLEDMTVREDPLVEIRLGVRRGRCRDWMVRCRRRALALRLSRAAVARCARGWSVFLACSAALAGVVAAGLLPVMVLLAPVGATVGALVEHQGWCRRDRAQPAQTRSAHDKKVGSG